MRQLGEEAVDDLTSRDKAKPFKWVGTAPVRPDGVPKVTGTAKYGNDFTLPGALYGKVLRSPHAHARIKSIDTSKAEKLVGVKAVVTAKDFPDQNFAYIGPERVAVNFWHVTRNIMAREKALYEGHAVAAVLPRSTPRRRRRPPLIKVNYEVLPHVIDVDEAMKPDAPLLFEDMKTRGVEPAPKKPSNVSKRSEFAIGDVEAGFKQADVIVENVVQDGAGASGLHRAASLRRPLRRRRPGRDLDLEPGAFHRPRLHRKAAWHESRRPASLSGGDWRRVRRQDRDLHRAGRRHAGAEVRPSREDRDEPRGCVQGHRPDLRRVHDGEDRRQDATARLSPPTGSSNCRPAPFRARRSSAPACAPLRPTISRMRARSATTWCATARRSRPIARRARRSAPSRWRACSTSWLRRSAWTRWSCA